MPDTIVSVTSRSTTVVGGRIRSEESSPTMPKLENQTLGLSTDSGYQSERNLEGMDSEGKEATPVVETTEYSEPGEVSTEATYVLEPTSNETKGLKRLRLMKQIFGGDESPSAEYPSSADRTKEKPLVSLIRSLEGVKKTALSFSGAGFLASYHFGVANCLIKNGKPFLSRVSQVAGCSAGSLAAAMILLAPEKIEDATIDIFQLATDVRKQRFGALTPGYYLHDQVHRLVEKYVPEDISPAQDRLLVSLTTRSTQANRLISKFESRDQLVSALTASCFIPYYSSGLGCKAPKIDDIEYVDGGLSNNLPKCGGMPTVTVSPFSSIDAWISPSDVQSPTDWKINFGKQSIRLNTVNGVRAMDALFPPSRQTLQSYYNDGFKDAFYFLLDQKLVKRQEGTAV